MSRPGTLVGTDWVLTGPPTLFGDEGSPTASVSMGFSHDGISGNSGCNRFHGTYRVDGTGITIGQLAGTMMACEPTAMALERAVLQRLAQSATFVLADDGATLALLDGDGTELLVYAVQGPDELVGSWVVNAIHHPAREAIISVSGDRELTVEFEDSQVSGDAGCNTFRGSCTADGKGLTIGPLRSTRKWCGDEMMEQEQALLAALANTVGFRLEGGRLTLLRPDGLISVSLHRAF